MAIECHSVRKYATGELLAVEHAGPLMRVETWRHGAGRLPELTLTSTEVAVMLSGRLSVERTGDGRRQRSQGAPGMFWLCPAGVHETDIALSATMHEVVHFFLPPSLLGDTALEEFGLDAGRIELDYAGGAFDPLLNQIALRFREMRRSPAGPADRLLADGLRLTLASHLLAAYLTRRLVPPAERLSREPLDGRRLQAVAELVEARLSEELTLRDLAAAACLSPFHFSRMFRRSTGQTPHQYVLERRIETAKRKLAADGQSLVEVALSTGFGSQSSFNRAFRKATGRTPGQYRTAAERPER